jgi:hypothetical protein
MKSRILYTLFILAGTVFLFQSNSSGAGEIQGVDRTGSPLSPAACIACHSAGAFSAGIEVEMLDGGSIVSTYEPGQTYTLRVRATHSGSPAGFGFQAVTLKSADNSQAGSFGTPPSGIQITTLSGGQYVEQSSRSDENVFEIDWVAPESGSGDIDIYASVVVANGMNGSGGDGAAFLTEPVTLTEVVSNTADVNGLLEDMTIFPNPVSDQFQLLLNSKENANYQLIIANMQGQRLLNQRVALTAGEQSQTIDISTLSKGVYTLILTDGQLSSTRRIIKQ